MNRTTLNNETPLNKKDFSWQGENDNPFAIKKEKRWKSKLEIFILFFSLFTTLGFLLFHPFFKITKTEIFGLQRIGEAEVREDISGLLEHKIFGIFPADSYLATDIKEIADILKARFPFSSVIIKKEFPNLLTVEVEEQISTVIYDSGKDYSYLNMEGSVVEKIRSVSEDEWRIEIKISTTTAETGEIIEKKEETGRWHTPPIKKIISEMGDYPLIYDSRGKETYLNALVLNSQTIKGIVEWFNIINTRTDVPFGYAETGENEKVGIIHTREGWHIKAMFDPETIENQFIKLETVLSTVKDRRSLQYINVRYPERVYWK